MAKSFILPSMQIVTHPYPSIPTTMMSPPNHLLLPLPPMMGMVEAALKQEKEYPQKMNLHHHHHL